MTKKILLFFITTAALFPGAIVSGGTNTYPAPQTKEDKAPPTFENDSYNDVDENCKSAYKGDAHKTNMKTQKKL